ncbi:MAG: HRDC domain-containing protein [Bacteroidota bacterium]
MSDINNDRLPPLERMLRAALRHLRFELAKYEGIPPYRIFNNQSLLEICDNKPSTLSELQAVVGMGDYRCNRYGGTILLCVKRTLKLYRRQWFDTARIRAGQPAQQAIKSLFESGFEASEIAQSRQIQKSSVIRSLEYLQHAGEISTGSWVEEQIPDHQLQNSQLYFAAHPQSDLKSAYEALGLDYDTLRMCRMYVSNVERMEF